MKRYLSGRRLTLSALEDMCRILGVGLGEFYEIAAKELGGKQDKLTPAQEEALAADPELMMVLVLLLLGQTAQETGRDLALEETQLFPLLMQLERLGLVKVYPGNRVSLLVSEKLIIPAGSPIRNGFNHVLKQDFMNLDYSSEASMWSVHMAKLSAASVAQLGEVIESFEMQVRALADKDRRSGTAEKWLFTLSTSMTVDLPDYIQRVRARQSA